MSELFAFRTAISAATSFAAEDTPMYDSRSQTSSWESGTPVLAVHCTYGPYRNWARPGCNAYGSYCTTYGNACGHYTCD